MGPDAAFWIRAARHEATTPDSVAREGLWDAAEYPSVRVTCRLREPLRYLRCPGGGPAVSHRDRHGYRIRSELGTNRGAGDRMEVARDRKRSIEIDRGRPTFADLRSTTCSPASGPFDPIWSILKPPN